MTDRKEQLRAAAARWRQALRDQGLEPHQVWATREEWEKRIKPLLDAIEAGRLDAENCQPDGE